MPQHYPMIQVRLISMLKMLDFMPDHWYKMIVEVTGSITINKDKILQILGRRLGLYGVGLLNDLSKPSQGSKLESVNKSHWTLLFCR